MQQSIAQDLANDLQSIYDDFQLMGLSVVVSNGTTSESYHYGLRDFDRNLEVNSSTQFRIASISKAFTALGAMKLVDEGSINLDTDISDALGYSVRNPNFPNQPITLRMLLSHQSSLQDGSGYFNFLTATYTETPVPNIEELLLPNGIYYSANMWRTEAPGSYFAYSNVNFGLIATVIEAVSGVRFDVFMKNEILMPLGIEGSFNIQDINDINNVAVLYRNNGGWEPQFDNYQGVYPSPPDLSEYVPGTNGIYFAPQGGLRVSGEDVDKFLEFLRTNGGASSLNISEATINEMLSIQWDYNGTNGDNYFGLFNRWGLGVHHANVNPGDQICNLGTYGSFLGHAGEAYGLISDAFFSAEENVSFVVLINGAFNGYQIGNNSSFYTVEEAIFSAICEEFENVLTTDGEDEKPYAIIPNPVKHSIQLFNRNNIVKEIAVYNLEGKLMYYSKDISNSINVENWQAGIYLIQLKTKTDSFYEKIIIE